MFVPPVARPKPKAGASTRPPGLVQRQNTMQAPLGTQCETENPVFSGQRKPWDFGQTPLFALDTTAPTPAVAVQSGGEAVLRRSPLSDSVKSAWTADPKIETLLARLSQPDVQTAQSDTDVDTEISRDLSGRADDLWVAQRIRKGELGQTTGALGKPDKAGKPIPRKVEAVFIRGSTDRRALVIAGVHGTEKQGIEVARLLIADLKSGPPPALTAIIVPSLFPDDASMGSREAGSTHTNRNFPHPSEDLAAATAAGNGTPMAAPDETRKRRPILPENLMLIELMERFHPERIISIHGTWRPGGAGAFYDRRAPNDAEDRTARALANGLDGGQELPPALQEKLYREHLAAAAERADQTDRDLALRTAAQIDAATSSLSDREARGMVREKEKKGIDAKTAAARRKHPSVSGNVGPTGALDNATWGGGSDNDKGVSLGGYAPARGVSVFTVEPPVDAASDKYADVKGGASGTADKLTKAERISELQAYADAVRTILLGTP